MASLFTTTPQSIRLAAYCQLPRKRWRLWKAEYKLIYLHQKLSPRAGKVARSAERGAAKNSRMPRVIPPQLRLRSAAPPFHGGAFGCSTNSAYSAVPLRGAIVSMGLRGVQGGLRGEIEIFPGPPAKKVIKKLPSLLFISTPQTIRLTRVSALIFRIRRFQR